MATTTDDIVNYPGSQKHAVLLELSNLNGAAIRESTITRDGIVEVGVAVLIFQFYPGSSNED